MDEDTKMIPLGNVHVQLIGRKLHVQGNKASFNIDLLAGQLNTLQGLDKLENIMGTDLVVPVDHSKHARSFSNWESPNLKEPISNAIKDLGTAYAKLSIFGDSGSGWLFLNKVKLALTPNNVEKIKNDLGME